MKKIPARGTNPNIKKLPYKERLEMYERAKNAVYMDPTLTQRAREIELKRLIAKYDI